MANRGYTQQDNITRRIKQGAVDIDFEESALVVNYEVETVELDGRGMVIDMIDCKPEVRRIKIKALAPDKNMAQLAEDIVDKCKYIHPSRVEEIEQLLIKLRKHNLSTADRQQNTDDNQDRNRRSSTSDNKTNVRSSSGKENKEDAFEGRSERPAKKAPSDDLPPADINELDNYLDMLYQVSGKSEKEKEQGLRIQERGTAMMLKLCQDVMNLEQLIQNSTVMGAITRVLQEEFKKSVDLTFNILRIFLAFSNFSEMHSLMANYRIGVLTMKAIEFEVKRTELREIERFAREKELNEELTRAKESQSSDYRQVSEKVRLIKEKEAAKQRLFVRKQDKLLFVGFYVLLNLAEDVSVERKMIKKDLLPMLVSMLSRTFEDLLILVVTFLKKLSVFEENKDQFKELNVIEHCGKFLGCTSQPLTTITLRFLFNLSFDKDMREMMLKCGYIPKLVSLLKVSTFRAKTLKLLYHLSVDDRCKSMVTYTDGVGILMGMVINFPQDMLAKELAALAINLSYNPRIAEQMINNRGLNLLVDRFTDKRDPLLMKVIRNISLWTFTQQQEMEAPELNYKYRGLWSPHIKILIEIMIEESNHDIVIEILGTLSNMTMYDVPATANWSKLIRDHNLVGFFSKLLIPGISQNDVLLEIIMVISTVATDAQACNILAKEEKFVKTLYQLLKDKQDDTEIILQLLNCFHKLLYTTASREALMYSTRLFADIIDCLTHRSAAIRSQAEKMSEFVLEYDRKADGVIGALGKQVIKKRFESYNKVWLANVIQDNPSSGFYGGSEYSESPDYVSSGDKFQYQEESDWKSDYKEDGYYGRGVHSEVDSWNGSNAYK